MRITDHIRLAAKEVQRRPIRASLTLVALAISAIILVTLSSLSFGAQQAITATISPNNSLQTIIVTANKSLTPGLLFGSAQEATTQGTTLTDESVQDILAIPNVTAAVPRAHIWEFNTFTIGDSAKSFVAQAEGITPELATLPLSAGQMVADKAENTAVVGLAYAQALGKEPVQLLGQKITITTQKGYRGDGATIPGLGATQADLERFAAQPTQITATIVGVTGEGSNQNSIFVPLDWARQVRTASYWEKGGLKKIDQLERDGYSSVIAQVANTSQVEAVEAELAARGFGSGSALGVVKQWLSLSTALWSILGAVAIVALIAACLGIINTMLVAVSEQRQSIGVWRAFGATKKHIAMQFLLQALIIGCLGGLIGVVAGVIMSNFVNTHISGLLQAGNLQQITVVQTPGWLLVGCFVLVAASSVLAGLYPALRAARQDPAKSLNAE